MMIPIIRLAFSLYIYCNISLIQAVNAAPETRVQTSTPLPMVSRAGSSDQKMANTQSANIIGAALTSLQTGAPVSQVAGGKDGDMKTIADYMCENNKGIDGNMQQLKEEQKQKCIEEAQKKRELIENLVNNNISQQKDCVVKASKKTMICHTKKVISDMINTPYYVLQNNGNVFTLEIDNEKVAMAVKEGIKYCYEELEKPQHAELAKPNQSVKFNKLGQVLSKEGLPPKSAAMEKNPCANCLSMLNNKAKRSVEGVPDECERTCEDGQLSGLEDLTNSTFFTKSNKKGDINATTKPASGSEAAQAGA
ncbi:hypothetical protein EDEG_00335 [Edhazardia aedis USNM 41457]|uniref:Polar tube protein 2 n=1 Tax=Edhazardia aedis (strain USNM 41457) TaxID=1003232 RepID=J9DH24_EDHAE|nr:hypothetical protein EDEG_00335 [Edhazardia aedis USNM 41457]|eukprot:EJW01905.1 hypothetical protein EDEG_00335 [Edhazardia aedis USNM 41457]